MATTVKRRRLGDSSGSEKREKEMESPRFPMRVCLLSSHSHGGCAPTVNVFGKTCNMAEMGWIKCQAQPARYQSAGTCQANQFNSTVVHNGATGVRHRARVSGQVPSCRTVVRSPSSTGTRPATVELPGKQVTPRATLPLLSASPVPSRLY